MSGEDLNNNEEIPPFSIPNGVTPEEVVKMVFDVLIRKALMVTDKWTHWVLVAALQILEYGTTPPLDVTSLRKLRGLCEEDCASNASSLDLKLRLDADESDLKNVDVDIKKSEKKLSIHVEDSTIAENNSDDIWHAIKYTPIKRSHSDMSDNRGIKRRKLEMDSVNVKKELHDTAVANVTIKNITEELSKVKPQKVEMIDEAVQVGILKYSFASQVTPRVLGITHNKWTQMWRLKGIHKSCQTEDPVLVKKIALQDAETQAGLSKDIESLGSEKQKATIDRESQTVIVHNIDRKSQTVIVKNINRESQTVIVHHKDFSSQCSLNSKGKHSATESWKLVPISGLPKRARCGATSSGVKISNNTVKISNDTKEMNVNLLQLLDPKYSKDSAGVKDEDESQVLNQINQNFFHGRLMITAQSKIDAPYIPENPIDSLLLMDPRSTENG